jgi:hypothetical protein
MTYSYTKSKDGRNYVLLDEGRCIAENVIGPVARMIVAALNQTSPHVHPELISRYCAASFCALEQAQDDGIWFIPETAAEAYLQQELRRLHALIEGKTPDECARETVKGIESRLKFDCKYCGANLYRQIDGCKTEIAALTCRLKKSIEAAMGSIVKLDGT